MVTHLGIQVMALGDITVYGLSYSLYNTDGYLGLPVSALGTDYIVRIGGFTLASFGCAISTNFGLLVGWRVVQGFSGGALIPAVFAAVFLLFPEQRQGIATMLAGVSAVLAPTVGPIVGGWITNTYSWHWLFLINVVPGIASASLRRCCCPEHRRGWPRPARWISCPWHS